MITTKTVHNGPYPKTRPGRAIGQWPRANQRGNAAVIVLAVFAAAASAIAAIGLQDQVDASGRTQMLGKQMDMTLSELTNWYQRDGLASLGTSTPTQADLQARLTTRFAGIRMAMSNPIVRSGCSTVMDCEPSRQILVWYPATSPQTAATPVNGLPLYETSGDAIWRLYDSKPFVQDRMASAYAQLLGVGRAISTWATTQQRSAVYAYTNYLRATSCASPGPSLPCLTGWTAITGVPEALAAAGVKAMDVTAPWGAVIEISNASPEASQTLPYSLALRLRTPSGAYLTYTAGQ